MTTPLDPGLGLSQPEPEPEPEPSAGVPRRRPRRVLFVVLLVAGVLLIAGGGAALGRELTRAATPAEAAAALRQEIATRWQRLPAGKIFPAAIAYRDFEGDSMVARLVGIAPPASCRAALGPAGYALVRGFRCATILRATYVDASGTLAATVGVAALGSQPTAAQAADFGTTLEPGDGLHAVTFGGTIAGQFGDAARGIAGDALGGPYLFLYTAGFTDGLPGSAAAAQTNELTALGSGVDAHIRAVLTGHGKPCEMKDITC